VFEGPGVAPATLRAVVSDNDGAADREAEFARLVLPLRRRMMGSVWRVVRDPDLAEDAYQEALTTIWRKLDTVRTHANPEALILRICLNAACDQLRARQRAKCRLEPLGETEPATEVGPSDAVEEAEVVEQIQQALARLKPRQATALLLRAVHEEPYSVVAQALGCSEVTARVHVQRAREKLRQWLAHLRQPVSKEVSS
jgi:RNA polymerase sigma factor (sigma-70 family)